jgi:hypothetical protein
MPAMPQEGKVYLPARWLISSRCLFVSIEPWWCKFLGMKKNFLGVKNFFLGIKIEFLAKKIGILLLALVKHRAQRVPIIPADG